MILFFPVLVLRLVLFPVRACRKCMSGWLNNQRIIQYIKGKILDPLQVNCPISHVRGQVDMVSSQESADGCVSSDELQQKQSFDSENAKSQQILDENIHNPQSEKGRNTAFSKIEAAVQESDAAVSLSQSYREGSKCSLPCKKTLRSPKSSLLSLQSSVEGSYRKIREDGYNWRKYGQKQVRGNKFIRNYYKCTSPNCPAKKQLECSHNGQITNIVYFGQHDHPKPRPDVSNAVLFDVTIIEETPKVPFSKIGAQSAVEHGPPPRVFSGDNVKDMHSRSTSLLKDKAHKERGLESKRRKKDNGYADPLSIKKSTGEHQVVIQTRSEVDIVNDGYRWRKYGQKLVKGNANPRSYYRCSSALCPAKKHVERASYDAKVVLTTYEGQHNHDLPPSRTVTHNVGANMQAITNQADYRANSVSDAAELGTSENKYLEWDVSSDKPLNGETKTGSEVNDVVTHPAKDSETLSIEPEHQNTSDSGSTPQEYDSVGTDGKVYSSRPNENVNNDHKKTQSEERKAGHQDIAVHDSFDPEI